MTRTFEELCALAPPMGTPERRDFMAGMTDDEKELVFEANRARIMESSHRSLADIALDTTTVWVCRFDSPEDPTDCLGEEPGLDAQVVKFSDTEG